MGQLILEVLERMGMMLVNLCFGTRRRIAISLVVVLWFVFLSLVFPQQMQMVVYTVTSAIGSVFYSALHAMWKGVEPLVISLAIVAVAVFGGYYMLRSLVSGGGRRGRRR